MYSEFFNKNTKVIIDTCSLMEQGAVPASNFFTEAMKNKEYKGNEVIVALQVIKELEKHASHSKYDGSQAIKLINKLLGSKSIVVAGTHDDKIFADNVFHYVINQHRLKYNILFITQDRKLARDLALLNLQSSVEKQKQITIKKLGSSGKLENFHWMRQFTSEISKVMKKDRW